MAKATSKKASKAQDTKPAEAAPIITYKGFDKDLKCRELQYEIGKEYGRIVHIKAAIAGRNGIKPDV